MGWENSGQLKKIRYSLSIVKCRPILCLIHATTDKSDHTAFKVQIITDLIKEVNNCLLKHLNKQCLFVKLQ